LLDLFRSGAEKPGPRAVRPGFFVGAKSERPHVAGMTLSALGDCAFLLPLGERIDAPTMARVRACVAAIREEQLTGVTDVVGAFASVAVFFEPRHMHDPASLEARVAAIAQAIPELVESNETPRRVEIPVCYGGEFGPDLSDVATHTGMAAVEVITAHHAASYQVHALGFAPGFPYLGGLPPELSTPRRAAPRTSVAAGSVGIGGAQTGVYPFATPGGWNLIGRTPLRLFDIAQAEPALLRAGDEVRFVPMDVKDFRTAERERLHEPEMDDVATFAAGAIEVVKPGVLTTVQDLGRVGYRAAGVSVGGAADSFALRVANALVGNDDDAAGLEFTLVGPELRFERAAWVGITGGDFGVPRGRPLHMAAGETLRFGPAVSGCRGYLAVAGGVSVSQVLGSRATNLTAGFGGYKGRALRAGDRLACGEVNREFSGRWRVDDRILTSTTPEEIEIRFLPGAQMHEFPADWGARGFAVSTRSNRMGVRLSGPAVARGSARELLSAPVAPGTLQVPPDGQPIILLADAQTVGGYPQLGHVVSVDLSRVAQLRPGQRVRFRPVSLDEAHALSAARERALGLLREGVAQKLA
jgi:KipI family sensor histidine kinase inhibitor